MTDFPADTRDAFPVVYPMTLRWRDNDVYGHMNNAFYYEYFDTAVNQWLIESGALTVPNGPVIGLVAETGCRFLSSVGFPGKVDLGLTTMRVGNTSVVYGLGLFEEDSETAAAVCRFVHVYVDAETRRPTPLPPTMREKLLILA
ncbi:MAG: thioesterase family protein [Pseudomonadota bacterium]